MSTTEASRAVETPATPVVALATLALLAGVGGMAVSFIFLASRSHLDFIAGAIGFISGSVLVAAGLLSLAILSRSPSASHAAKHTAGALTGLLPPGVAALGWPTFFCGVGLLGIWMMPFVLVACMAWAWSQSRGVAGHLSELSGLQHVRLLRASVFVMQSIAIVATWPLFGYFLRTLESMGYKVGWS
jgi:hypothetical protein